MKKVILTIAILFAALSGLHAQTQIAGTPGGGFFVSANGGTSWTLKQSGLNSYRVQAMTSVGTVWFAATEYGVFKSTNTGTTWAISGTGIPASTSISDITVAGSAILATTYGTGVYRSTDNGATWLLSNSGLSTTNARTIQSIIYDGDGRVFVGTVAGIYKSPDFGVSWVNATTTSHQNALIVKSAGTLFAGSGVNGVYKSTDFGITWAPSGSGIPSSDIRALMTDGVNVYASNYGNGIYKSTNNGTNWIAVNSGLTDLSVNKLMYDATGLYAGTNTGGIFKSTNAGVSWTQVNTGISNFEIRALASVPDPSAGRIQDSLALCAIYDALDGPNWTNQTGWAPAQRASSPLNTWYGVNVHSVYNRVVDISLSSNNLKGNLPNAIGWLDSLNYLYLGYNKLTGTFPDSLFQLKALTYLYINDGRQMYDPETQTYPYGLTGTIPIQFTNLKRLNNLYLGGNRFTGQIPTFWTPASMPALRTLDLTQNDFTGTIPAGLGNATQLTYIRLAYNNGLTAGALPSEFALLTNLTYLDVTSCNLTGIPNLQSLVNLQELNIGQNQLTGAIPSWIGTLTGLHHLQTRYNPFDRAPIPSWIYNLTNLQGLMMEGDSLTGVIDPKIGRLTNLNSMNLNGNLLSGTIPDSINNLISLGSLYLNENMFTGNMPAIPNLTNLYSLYLYSNQLTGLPNLSALTNLNNFSVYVNKFTFEDIEPNMPRFGGAYNYSPQDSVGVLRDTLVQTGQPITISVAGIPVGGTGVKSYQWLKDGVTISGANGSSYTISSVLPSDAGPYVCRINDANVPGLDLYSRVFTLDVIIPPLAIADSLALVALYDSLNGVNWPSQANWKTSNPVSTWYGVTLTSFANATRVTGINLYNDSLAGRIPAAIGNLTELITLNMGYNRLNGTIPNEITNLHALEVMDFYSQTGIDYQNGGLTGPIPANIGNMTALKQIQLGYNKLTGSIPSSIGSLPSLQYLLLYGNQLTGTIPVELWNATSLISLELWGNQLVAGSLASAPITNLTQLQTLTLPNSGITAFPDLTGMNNLANLDISTNQITGAIPSWFGDLPNLHNLTISNNPFTAGPLPSYFSNMTQLYTFNAHTCNITGTFPSLLNLTNLYYLVVQYNQIDDFPDLSSMTGLNQLYVDNNKLNFGDIQPNIIPGRYFQYGNQAPVGTQIDTTLDPGDPFVMSVASINVGGSANQYQWMKNFNDIPGANSVSYSIVSAAPSDNGAYVCKITDNNVPGLILQTLPFNVTVKSPTPHLGDSLALVALYDSLGGPNWSNQNNWKSDQPINTWYGISVTADANFTRVSGISLSNNNLQGRIPSALGRMDSLKVLDLYGSALSGSIPDSLYALQELQVLKLTRGGPGGLTGSISPKIGRLTKLRIFEISYNSLSGALPDSLFTLTQLEKLEMNYSGQFNSSLSPSIGNLTNLTELYMSGNQFTGNIPTQIGNLTALTRLDLSSNQFSGSIPSQIWGLTNLQTLNLSYNIFTPGPLPAAVQNLSNLNYLFLTSDSLTGSIPDLIGGLGALYYLDLSRNQFTGTVPASLAGLTNFQYLYLNRNQLDSLPDLSSLNLYNLDVSYNKFDFADLIPNIGAVNQLSSFIYSPQDSIQGSPNVSVNLGSPFTVSVSTYNNGSNAYQWFRNKISIIGATGTSYNVASASASNTGGFYCRVTNPALPGLNLYSKTTRVTIEAAPAIPQLLDVVPGNGTAGLIWRKSAEPDIRAYYIYAGQSINPTTVVDSTIGIADTSRTLYGLSIGQRYYFRIKALDTLGLVSSYSNELSEIIRDATPPATPAGFTAYAGNEEVKLFWNINETDPDLSHYILYRNTTPGFTPAPADSQGLVNLNSSFAGNFPASHLDLTVENNTTYYYKVVAVDSSGNYSTLSPELTVTPSSAIPTWVSQSTPSSGSFYDVKFTDPRNGYVSTSAGTVLRTTNGGQDWSIKNPPVVANYRALEFLDSVNGWVGGLGSNLFLTNDGGDNWIQQVNGAGTIRDITFINSTHGWLGGSGTFGLRYTTNSGTNWNPPVTPTSPYNFRGVSFTDASNGWAGVFNSVPRIYRTNDGGVNWAVLADLSGTYPGYSFINFQMVDAFVGYAAGGNSQHSLLLKTTDGGNSWFDVSPASVGKVEGLDFLDVNNGWIATETGLIFHTTNGGSSWEFQSTRITGSFYAIDMIDPQGLGWVTKISTASVLKLNTLTGGGTNLAPTVSITAPDILSGYTAWGGRTAPISWTSNDDNGVAKIVIEFANDGTNFVTLGEAYTANGTYIWNVPDAQSTQNGKLRITAYDQQGLSASSQTFGAISIFPNGSYTHTTSQASLTMQNNGEIGTGRYGLTKPSFQYPLGAANDQLFMGLFYLGFVRNPGDTVGVASPFGSNYYEPLSSFVTTDFGSYKQSVASYRDNFGAGVEIQQSTVSKNDGKFFIVEYAVTNKSGSQINDLFLGQWFDFDVKPAPQTNLSGFDGSQLLAYIYDSSNPSGTHVGMKVLDTDPSTFRRFTSTQATALNTPGKTYSQFSAGVDDPQFDTPNDYNVEFGRGPYFISNNQTEKLAFVICAGTGLAELQSVAVEAQSFWTAIRTAPVTPTGVSATAMSESQIDLTWNSIDNASKYRIYRSINSSSGYVQVDSVSAPATSYSDDGLQPVSTYFYKIYAVNNVGLSPASAIAFATTNTPPPPAAPTGLTVSTLSTTSLKLDWTASASGNPTRYKIYRKGPIDADFVQIDSVPEVIVTYTNTGLTENTTYFYKLIASHPWGISSPTGPVSGNTMQAPPSITGASVQVNPATPTENQTVQITIPVAGSGLTVRLFFGKGNQLIGDSVVMTNTGGTSYSYTITADNVTYRGLWYRIKAINTAGVDIYPAIGRNDINVSVSNSSVSTIINSSVFSGGIPLEGYATISLPLATSLNLVPILGAQEFDGNNVPTNWRAVSYNATSQTFTNVTTLNANTAYFIYVRGSGTIQPFTNMAAGNTNPKTLFDSYVLKPGWNLVPWPFAFSANITVTDAAKVDPIWHLTGGSWAQVSQVGSFGGYAIRNKTSGDVVLGTAVAWTASAGKHLADADWSIRFKAESSKRQDYFNYIGVTPVAAETYDNLDVSEPMSMGNDVSLYFTAKNELGLAEKLASDVRSDLVDGNIWEMNIANNVNEKTLTLNWEPTAMPPNHKMMMVDVNNNEFINLDELQTYTFRARKDNKFKVVVGKNEFVDQAVEKIRAELPKEFALQQNYPNPFNPTTNIRFDVASSGNVRLKVYNVLGQEVATLVDGYYETGKHIVSWNGKDALGHQVASGVYMYRLEAGKIARTKKMMLVK